MAVAMSIFLLLGGVGVFLYGMKTMNTGIEGKNTGVHRFFRKIDKNRFIDYGIGIGATVIVQSSSATAIMTVGLANAGVVTVKQGSGIILGAKVGTTLTAFILALGLMKNGSFSLNCIFASLSFAGVAIIFFTNNDKLTALAQFLIGFGMLFVGLEVMEIAIATKNSALSSQLYGIFRYGAMQSPVLLVVAGAVITCVIQSSTAAVGMFLALLSTGVIASIDQSFFLVMGANVGTCFDAALAAVGAKSEGKQIAFFHVLTSMIGAVVFAVVLVLFRTPITGLFEAAFPDKPQWSLATYNLIYNLLYTLLLLPFLSPLLLFTNRVIKK